MNWTDAESAHVVLDRVAPLIHVSSDGTVSWSRYIVDDTPALLVQLIQWPKEWGRHDQLRSCQIALHDAARRNQLHPPGVLRAIQRQLVKRAKQGRSRFVMLSSLSIKHSSGLRRGRIQDSTISFTADPPKRFRLPRQAERAPSSLVYGPLPEDYCSVRVSVRDQTSHSAFDTALDRLDLLRSLWNLALNHSKGRRWSSGRIRPVNGITLGPIHTLHKPTGAAAVEFHWWEPGYVEPLPLLDLTQYYESIKAFEAWARAGLRNHRFGETVHSALLRYGRALDERELTTAFLKIWGVIEQLTGTANESYKVLCRRAAFIFKDRDYHYAVLKTLRDLRNRVIHYGDELAGSERPLYQAKRYAEKLLLLLLGNPREFETVQDLGTYLDLPTEPHTLRRRLKRLEMAVGLERVRGRA